MSLPPLIAALANAQCYPHAVDDVTTLETHISWILLAGEYAYKIKKPVALPFLDFTTLDKRRHYCEEELTLNRRLAPRLYSDVVEIRGAPDAPRISGSGTLLECALRMRRFPQEALASRLLAAGRLEANLIEALAVRLASFHAGLPPAARDTCYGSCQSVLKHAVDNLTEIAAILPRVADAAALQAMHDWIEREFILRYDTIRERCAGGSVRECHGDLHLGNIALIDGELVPFDCIEFSAELRWIDVMSEVAFLVMDLFDRGADALAWHFLNTYLEASDAYSGLAVLRFYLVHRSLVRAKAHLIRSRQPGLEAAEAARLAQAYRGYVALAQRCAATGRPAILLMHGYSGCGKSTVASKLAQELGAIRIRSDERKRMHGMAPREGSHSRVASGLYGQSSTQATYARLAETARLLVTSGYTAIVDAGFLLRTQRAQLQDVAARAAVPIVLIDVATPVPILRRRLTARAAAGRDLSEADLQVLAHQMATAEAIDTTENLPMLTLDGRATPDAPTVGLVRVLLERELTRINVASTPAAYSELGRRIHESEVSKW